MTAPLFRFDAGWLFVAAGLVVCAAGVVLPAQGDLRVLQQQLEKLRSEEAQAYARLKAYNDFLDQLDEEDPALVRRLAASQLNIVPASDRPVLLSTAQIAPVTNWIEATVAYEPTYNRLPPDSTLGRLASGPSRLWLFAGGIMCVFIGLLMGPGATRKAGMIFSLARGGGESVEVEVAKENICSAAVLDAPAVQELVSPCSESAGHSAESVVDSLAAQIDAELVEEASPLAHDADQVDLEVELAESALAPDDDTNEDDDVDAEGLLIDEAVEAEDVEDDGDGEDSEPDWDDERR